MTSNFVHVFFRPHQGRVFVAIERREADFGYGVAISDAPTDHGRLVAAFFPPRRLPACLYSFPHDFASVRYVRVDVYRLGGVNDPPEAVQSVVFDPAWRADGVALRLHAFWQALAIGFKAGDRHGGAALAAYHGAAVFAVPPQAPRDEWLGEEFARAMTASQPVWTFTPVFIWAARCHWDATAGVLRAEATTLLKPAIRAPLKGTLHARLSRDGPRGRGQSSQSALEKAMAAHPRRVAVFRAEFDDAGLAKPAMKAALLSSACLAHVSLKGSGFLEAAHVYAQSRDQQRTYTMQRAEFGASRAGRQSPVALKPPTVGDDSGSWEAEFAVERPGLGDLFIFFHHARLLDLALAETARVGANTDGEERAQDGASAANRASRDCDLAERWFVAAGDHLLEVDADRDAFARQLGLQALIVKTREEAKKLLGGESLLEEGARLLRTGFARLAAGSDEDCTARAYGRAGPGFDDVLAAQCLASFLRETSAANSGERPLGSSALADHLADAPGLVAVAARAGLAADPTAIELVRASVERAAQHGPFPPAAWIRLLGGAPGKGDFLALKPPGKQLEHLVGLLLSASPRDAHKRDAEQEAGV